MWVDAFNWFSLCDCRLRLSWGKQKVNDLMASTNEKHVADGDKKVQWKTHSKWTSFSIFCFSDSFVACLNRDVRHRDYFLVKFQNRNCSVLVNNIQILSTDHAHSVLVFLIFHTFYWNIRNAGVPCKRLSKHETETYVYYQIIDFLITYILIAR